MSDNNESFRAILASDAKTAARWDAVVDRISSEAKTEFGVTMTEDEIMGIPSARLAVLTEDSLGDRWKFEAESIPSVRAAKRGREIAAHLASDSDESAPFLKELANMTPQQRINYAREHSLGAKVEGPRKLSADEERRALARILTLPYRQRIVEIRRLGLA